MKFNLPKIVRSLHLSDYAPEMGDITIQVWVNPPRGMLEQFYGYAQAVTAGMEPKDVEKLGEQIIAWFAEIWSQGPEDTRWTVDEVKKLIEETAEANPALYPWLTQRTREMIMEYRSGQKKV